MRYTKWFASIAMVAGMGVAGTTAASAQDWRDIRHDSYRIEAMRDHIARDRARLNEDIRCGRQEAAARDAADLARDQRALSAPFRDVRRDVNGYDTDDYNRGYYGNDYNRGYYGNGYDRGYYGNDYNRGYYGNDYNRGYYRNWR